MTPDIVWPSPLTFSLVGPGRVGSSIAHWAVAMGATLSKVAGRSSESAAKLVEQLGGQVSAVSEMETATDHLLLICVSDNSIEEVAIALSSRNQARVVLHTSGRHDCSSLTRLRHLGSSIGSLHPLMAFPSVSPDPQTAEGVVFGVDGDHRAVRLAAAIASGLGGSAVEIDPEIRPLYHLAATLSAGGVVTLVAAACELASQLGLDSKISRGYLRLAQGALEAATRTDSVSSAITGPIARGDNEEYESQIAKLQPIDPDLARIVRDLAARTRYLVDRNEKQ